MSRREVSESKVYIGNIPRGTSEKDIERSFEKYGVLKSVWVARNPPGFAFVEYEDPRDAQDAVKGMDGSTICGARVRVEHATGGNGKPKNRDGGFGRREFGRRPSPKRGYSPRRRDSPKRRDDSYGDDNDYRRPSDDSPVRDRSNRREYERRGRGPRRTPSPNKRRSRTRSKSARPSPDRSRSRS